jgi:hypothetical protein
VNAEKIRVAVPRLKTRCGIITLAILWFEIHFFEKLIDKAQAANQTAVKGMLPRILEEPCSGS